MPTGVKKLSKEWRENIAKAMKSNTNCPKGDKNPAKRPEVRKKIGDKNRGRVHTKEQNEQFSKMLKQKYKKGLTVWNDGIKVDIEKYPNYGMNGKHHSEKTKRKLKLVNIGRVSPMKGKHPTEEARRKMSVAHKGQVPWIKGKHHSQETRKKIKKARAKQVLPIKDTSIEVKIQTFLKELGYEFFTHQYTNIIHAYQCDILIPAKNIVIEVDGNYWHNYPIGKDIDHVRTKELIAKGFKVLRLWEVEINEMTIKAFQDRVRGIA